MNPQVQAAIIALGGVLVGILARDIIMSALLVRLRRKHELEDRNKIEARSRQDMVRLYADPLFQAAQRLYFRLDEIIERGPATYLMSDIARTEYTEYKRLSTFYRLASVLGWIQAFRRERSYLDPIDSSRSQEVDEAIAVMEKALADGQHIEQRRLEELLRLWRVENISDQEMTRYLACELDSILQNHLSSRKKSIANKLDQESRVTLCHACRDVIAAKLAVDIPVELVNATTDQAIVFMAIEEAYIYRDWQAAIGDMMLSELKGALRRFDIMGYAEFEKRYVESQSELSANVWFKRIESLFENLDMSKTGVFDARRDQIRALNEACKNLRDVLKCN